MKLDLFHLNRTIGTLTVFSDPRQLKAERTVDGLVLQVRGEVHFHFDESPRALNGYATGMRLTLYQDGVEVGVGDDPGFHWGQGDHQFSVGIRLTAKALAAVERRRGTGPLMLRAGVQVQSGVILMHEGMAGLVSRPVVCEGTFDLEFDRDRWVDLIRTTGWGDNIIVEVALPPTPEPPWDAVWTALRSAREALDRGGPVAWKACITECRTVLETWMAIEPLDTGPGDLAPRMLTRAQRFDVIRQSVHRYAHEAVHSASAATTRSEASMVLAAVAGLLGERSNR
jgi:hypothetical protein